MAATKQKDVYETGPSDKSSVSVLITANAQGTIAPPMALFPHERITAAITSNTPKEWGIGRSKSGWMNAQCFYEYIANVFHPLLLKSGTTVKTMTEFIQIAMHCANIVGNCTNENTRASNTLPVRRVEHTRNNVDTRNYNDTRNYPPENSEREERATDTRTWEYNKRDSPNEPAATTTTSYRNEL